MIRINEVKQGLDASKEDLFKACKKILRIDDEQIRSITIARQSVDSRKKDDIFFVYSVDVEVFGDEDKIIKRCNSNKVIYVEPFRYEMPENKRKSKYTPVVVGLGPAGLFAAHILAASGAQPIVLERGMDVDSRKKAVDTYFGGGKLDTECNIQFGEGGAGTFSDGKLTTGTKDPRQHKVLTEFVKHGAPEEIMYAGKPHIGTDLLSGIIKNMRNEIISMGGEFRFSCRLDDIYTENGRIVGVRTSKGDIETDTVILATGHSARDTFRMIFSHGAIMEKKSFSVGVRIEHPQSLINDALYHGYKGELPAADYKAAVHLKDGRGVYTFCMCPGGTVVAAASEENTVVTNGMSNFARNGENANSALLVSVTPEDFSEDIFSGMEFQQKLEKAAFYMGGANYFAPAQTVADFHRNERGTGFGKVNPTYPVGVTPSNLSQLFPDFITHSLREGIVLMDRKIKGFNLPDAVLTGVESRSSSPVRIVRGDDLQSNIKGLYPCGEGAGYAGGIMSAAVDGIRIAEAVLGKKES